MKQPSANRNITVQLGGSLALPLAPENISTIALYQVHLNLWDTLLGSHGSAALATLLTTEGEGTIYQFEIRPDAKFSNGRKVTSADIDFSLKRLIARQTSGHINAKTVIKSIDAISDKKFNIVLNEPMPSFLFLLSIPEMGIVPREACDAAGNVKDLTVTSGPYIVAEAPSSERLTLKKNRFFTRNDPDSPDEVFIRFQTGDNAVQSGEPDFMESYETSSINKFRELTKRPEYSYKITKPSFSAFLITNPKRLTPEQRFSIARLVHEKLSDYYPFDKELDRPSYEILPPETFGSLNLRERPKGETSTPLQLPTTIRIGRFNRSSPFLQALVKMFRDAKVEVEPVEEGNDYDLRLFSQGMNADYPEIEFYLNMVGSWATIPASDAEKALVLKIIHSRSAEIRTQTLQSIGHSLLDDARVIPILVRSYAHIFRNDRIDVSRVTTYDGDIPLWKMRVLK